MPVRHLPVRPDINALEREAAELRDAMQRGDADAAADLARFHPQPPALSSVTLNDARLTLARSYEADDWSRLQLACELIDAIWKNDVAMLRALVQRRPSLVHENTGIRKNYNWGPPLSYAANLGRDEIILALHDLGAKDLAFALNRAVLQSRIGTATMLHKMLGAPRPDSSAFGDAAYTLSVSGTEFLFSVGGQLRNADGLPDAPVDVVLQTDSRNPVAKHAILDMYAAHGFALPDTPLMALHRGRLDLLEAHIDRDPGLLHRTFTHAEIFPAALKCHQPAPGSYDEALPRTPLEGTTLLHMCVEFAEIEIARWLLQRGARADTRAAVDTLGFGGHTALFNAVVSYANFWMNFTGGWDRTQKPDQATFAELLLDHGANANARASFREPVGEGDARAFVEHRDATPLAWGDAFRDRMVVSAPAMRAIEARGGVRTG